MTTEVRLLTAEEFAALEDPEDGSRQELLDGEVCEMPPPAHRHGLTVIRIGSELDRFVRGNRLGQVTGGSGYTLRRRPDTVMGPDVAFTATMEALEGRPYPERSPDLAIEVVSPSERAGRQARKLREYFAAGAQRVWFVWPETRTVTVHRPNGDAHTYESTATLTSEDAGFAVEGFILLVADMFA